jgi:hypothetical protein
MLVTRITGDCPGCGGQASFGNVFVHGQILTRGCLHCNYKQEFYLPQLSKTVLYLDQSFFSHTFRAVLPEFAECAKSISDLAHDQLVVCPISSVHRTETHLWPDDRGKELWEFIKSTSRGHEFEPAYSVKHHQIIKSFQRFLANDSTDFSINPSDALPHDLDDWEDYFRIDVESTPDNVKLTGQLKKEAVTGLVNLFPKWRASKTNFQEHLMYELRIAGEGYIDSYLEMMKRAASGDYMAAIDSPIDSMVVSTMFRSIDQSIQPEKQAILVRSYFQSDYFRRVPYEFISAGLITVLRERVRNGHFRNAEKGLDGLKGFFFDLQFIAAYVPYCDAMFLDTAMHSMASDKRLALEKSYGTKFYSKSNWGEFRKYLDSIRQSKTEELTYALELVYPPRPS